MNKIKQQFTDIRKNTPRHIQWMLLVVAFVVLLVLLTMMFGGNKKNTAALDNDLPIELIVSPSYDLIDWGDITVGDTRNQTIQISASAPVKIMAVRSNSEVPGLTENQTCTNLGQIDTRTACTIVLEYQPTVPVTARSVTLFIDWRAVDAPDEMKKTNEIVLVLGAKSPTITPQKPAVVPEPTPIAPEPTPVISQTPEQTVPQVSPSIQQKITDSVAQISQFDLLDNVEPVVAPAHVPTKTPIADTAITPSESCSDFAIAGYNLSGVQIGWIRPSGGTYYFYPFEDKKCENPTGVYNQDNGIITDIKKRNKKIGTDAEHIGSTIVSSGVLPQLTNKTATRTVNRARQLDTSEIPTRTGAMSIIVKAKQQEKDYLSSDLNVLVNSIAHDRRFVLRQYKPIPATIVSDVRADPEALETGIPVRATVDRNVYADNGRTVIIPTGTLLMGYVTGTLPGPYKSVGRMDIKWYQFVLPNGVEFNFDSGKDAFSGDAQGRSGVPGRGSTDYIEQFVMPMLTAIVPAAVNMIAPVADKFVNQIDLDNNTVVQSGTVRSSELAKNEIITAWNQVAQKLLVDMMDNTVPPFSIAAGTRITVYSPVDLMVTCGTPEENPGKACAVKPYNTNPRQNRNPQHDYKVDYSDGTWTGQVRSFNLTQYCEKTNGKWDIQKDIEEDIAISGYDYRTVLMYCQSLNYQAINNAKQDAVFKNQQEQFQNKYQTTQTENSVSGGGVGGVSGDQAYNEQVLGLKYNEDGSIANPFESAKAEEDAGDALLLCDDGTAPDGNGCCTGEIYTDMGEQGFNCCPETGGDCFPPLL